MDTNLATLLEVVADEAGDRTAVIHGDTRRGWRELEERASKLARWLADAGVGEGDRVAIALFNGPEYLETVFALLKLRALPVNVNYRYRERELLELLTDASAVAIVFDAALDDVVGGVRDKLATLRTLLRLTQPEDSPDAPSDAPFDAPSDALFDAEDYETAVADSPAMPRIERSGDDGWLMFTGGTTGSPKGVVCDQRWLIGVAGNNGYAVVGVEPPTDVEESRATVRSLIDSGKSLRTLVAPPLMHGTGMYMSFGTMLTGGTVVYLPSRNYDPDELAEQIERHRVGHLCIVGDVFAVPLADALDAAAERGQPYDLSSLERVVSVGVIWSAEVKRRLLQHCAARMEDLLAASEGGPFARSVTTGDRQTVTARFELLPGSRVLDDDGNDVEPGSGQVGHLAAPTSPNTRYLDDPEKTAQTFRMIHGRRYVVAGDLATLDADGSLVLLGRDSRVINTGGEKVFAEEVEQVLSDHPAVADVNVLGVPDPRWGHRIVAVVERTPGAEVTEQELMEYVGATLAGYKRPRDVVFVPRIQRSPSGKIDLRWARGVATESAPAT